MTPDLPTAARSAPIERNVATIAKLEQATLEQQTTAERISAAIARFCGSLQFVVVHLVFVAGWITINQPSSSYRFDPYPYFLLVAIVAIEALLVSAFVLMNQNRMTVLAERRAHLGLQINLLAETEMTKVLKMLRVLTAHLQVPGAEEDEEAQELERPTEVENVVRVLDEAMPVQKAATSGRGQ
jgi:uncharacterized membrane protein